MELGFHGNQHPSSIKHPFISLYFKYYPFMFICLLNMNSPVFPSLDDIYCINISFFTVNTHSPIFRSFTQNVDALELLAGMDEEKLVEAHGSARGAHCLSCRKGFSRDWFVDKVSTDDAKDKRVRWYAA